MIGFALRFAIVAVAAFVFAEVSMAGQCPLTAQLVLRDLQSGIVGQTGTVWTIEPDCSFTVARQIALQTGAPHRRGQLTPEQTAKLNELLARIDPASFPAQIGEPQVNGREISLAYGGASSTLNLPPAGPGGGAARDQHATRLLDLAETLEQLVGD